MKTFPEFHTCPNPEPERPPASESGAHIPVHKNTASHSPATDVSARSYLFATLGYSRNFLWLKLISPEYWASSNTFSKVRDIELGLKPLGPKAAAILTAQVSTELRMLHDLFPICRKPSLGMSYSIRYYHVMQNYRKVGSFINASACLGPQIYIKETGANHILMFSLEMGDKLATHYIALQCLTMQ